MESPDKKRIRRPRTEKEPFVSGAFRDILEFRNTPTPAEHQAQAKKQIAEENDRLAADSAARARAMLGEKDD